MFKKTLIAIIILIINSCTNNTAKLNKVDNIQKATNDINLYNEISNSLNNLDSADDKYIKLKTDYENSPYLKKAAISLAKAHMQKKEYILANFYIQEALQIEPYNDKLKLMLIKNQFLAALNNKNSQDYLEKSYKALQEDINLLSSYENIEKAKKMLNEVKELLIKSYQDTSNFYKRVGKKEAAQKYIEKINDINATML